MGRRLSLDTGVLITLERGRLDPSILRKDDDICLSIMAVTEYLVGVALASEPNRLRMRQWLDRWLSDVPVLPYDEEILETHVKLLAWTKTHGQPRGQHDLIIAATAAVTGRTLVTLDRKAHFDELPGVKALVVG